MKFDVRISGVFYKEWKGSFYPKYLPPGKMLDFYGERFGAVEINNSFYRLPAALVVEQWAGQVPGDFKFVLKSPQRITHFQRLKNAKETIEEFVKVAGVLKERLGPLLFQLPGNFKKDVQRLAEFLKLLPAKQRVAMEFRHESWLDEEVYDVLRDRGAALCIAEAEDGIKIPLISTANWGYVRLRMPDYSDADLRKWIKGIRKQGWDEAFVFFKHEDEAKGPRFAKRFLELMK